MNFTQMHERLRLELLRRIQRGTLSVSLLARQTGFGQPHLSNFLHGRRQLSLEGIDRILAALHLTCTDLLASPRGVDAERAQDGDSVKVPMVSHTTALFEPYVRASAVQRMVNFSAEALDTLRPRATPARRRWQRFVAVRISSQDAVAMEPLILPEAIVLIDRHYDSLAAYRPSRPNLYAVRNGARLILRYADFLSGRLVLRPHNQAFPVELLVVGPDESPRDLICGRVALIVNES